MKRQEEKMSKVIVVGGGAAGMMAAVFAAENGHHVQIYEKNDRLGRKLFITGKGRCNITNASDVEELFQAVVSNPKFLYSAFYSFTNEQVIDFFENLGVKTKVERGNRVFPVSDHSSDIIGALQRELHRLGVQISLCTEVEKICVENEKITGIIISDDSQKQKQHFVDADAVIIATGGISYPATGSTGDGYRFAKTCGHKVTELFPALVPMEVKEWYAKQLQGLSLRNVCIRVTDGKRKLYEEFGEMLFTHYGVTGPVILSASSIVGKRLKEKELTLHIDLKPALTEEQLDKRILREFDANHNKQFKNAVDSLFPAKLKPVMTELSGIAEEKKVNEITKEERMRFVRLIKDFKMTLTSLRSYSEAIITKGGNLVNVIPDEVVVETLVRGKTIEAFTDAAKKTDRSFKAGAIAMGAKVEISTLPGYLPTLAEEALPELKHAAEISASGIPVIEASGHAGGSTDVGDVQHLMPVYTFNTGGVKGGLHQIDFEVTDEEEAYIVTAKMFALAAYGLLKEKAQRSRELVDQYEPVFKNSAEYVEFMEQFDSKER